MSSTLLYRAFGFRNYTCLRNTTQEGERHGSWWIFGEAGW